MHPMTIPRSGPLRVPPSPTAKQIRKSLQPIRIQSHGSKSVDSKVMTATPSTRRNAIRCRRIIYSSSLVVFLVLALAKTISKEIPDHNIILEDDIVVEKLVEYLPPITEEVITEDVQLVVKDLELIPLVERIPLASYKVQYLSQMDEEEVDTTDEEEEVAEEEINEEVEHNEVEPTRLTIEVPADMIYYDVPLSDNVQEYLFEQCKLKGVPMTLSLAVIWTESTYQEALISATNDYGLMQINRSNHGWLSRDLGINNFLDPYENIEAGVHMLGMYLSKYGSSHRALMAYHLGEGGASTEWNAGNYSSNYSNLVVGRMSQLRIRHQ